MKSIEIDLYDFLIPFGEPQNVAILNGILTFDLKNPKFNINMAGVFEFQKKLLEKFPEYSLIDKLVNDENHYWTVLTKKPEK